MSGFIRGASRLTCGAIWWLSASSLMAGWTMSAPLPNEKFDVHDEVDGYGDAPAGGLDFTFQITEQGLGSVILTDSQTTEDVWWNSVLGPPDEGAWSTGLANAVIYSANGRETYVTIEFE